MVVVVVAAAVHQSHAYQNESMCESGRTLPLLCSLARTRYRVAATIYQVAATSCYLMGGAITTATYCSVQIDQDRTGERDGSNTSP